MYRKICDVLIFENDDILDKLSAVESQRRARMRWFIMYTLVRNPSLVLYRKNEMTTAKIDSIEKDLLNYRLYAQTKVRLEELEKKLFKENVYEDMFSRNKPKNLAKDSMQPEAGKNDYETELGKKLMVEGKSEDKENFEKHTSTSKSVTTSMSEMPNVENLETDDTMLPHSDSSDNDSSHL